MFVGLTDSLLEAFRLVLPRDKREVDRYRGKYHQTAVSWKMESISQDVLYDDVIRRGWIFTCFNGTGIHRNYSNEEGGQDVEDRKDEIHLDRPLQVWLAPSEPWKA